MVPGGSRESLPKRKVHQPDTIVRFASKTIAFPQWFDYVGRFWDAVAPIARVSPFHYFDPFGLMGGRPLALSDVVTLLAIFSVGGVIANVAYTWRDL